MKDINNKVEEVYKILTTSKIRKAWPSNPEAVKEDIKFFLDSDQPLVLVTNWLGVKTTIRGIADKTDKSALLFIKKNIIDKLSKINVKVSIKILFTDINASYLEGYKKEKIDLYWGSLKSLVDTFGNSFKLIPVNRALWYNIFKLDGEEVLTLDEIAKRTKDLDILAEVKNIAERVMKRKIFDKYKSQAERHSLFVKNKSMTAEEVAKRYVNFRIFARRRYKKMFPHEIYFSYADPESQITEFIGHPTIYLFSIYKGFSDCPWFIDEANERFKTLIEMGKLII